MKLLWVILLLALASVPSGLNAQVQNDYEAGIAARQAGKPEEAKRLLVAWLATHPNDVDARLQLAYADLALGNLDKAQAGFEAVLRQAPAYADASDGLSLIAQRRAAPRETREGQFLLEGALSDLSLGARDWKELTADLTLPAGNGLAVGGRISYYRRFGLDDVELAGRIGVKASELLWLRAHVGGTPAADFRPEFSVGGGADLRLSRGGATVLTLDATYEQFPLQDVVTVNPGVVQYLAGGRGWITLRGIGTVADGGPLQVGGLLRGDYVPAEGWRLFSGAANGPDTDLGVVTRVTSLFGGIEAPLSKRFGLAGSIARDWRETGADRTEFRLGIKARF